MKAIIYLTVLLFGLSLHIGCDKPMKRGKAIQSGGTYSGYKPSFSPDGMRIVFSAPSDGLGEIMIYSLQEQTTEVIASHPAYDAVPQWCPSGEWIYFISERGRYPGLYRVRPKGGKVYPITGRAGWVSHFQVSPDGSHIACIHRKTTWDFEVFVYSNTLQHLFRLKEPEGRSVPFHAVGWLDKTRLLFAIGVPHQREVRDLVELDIEKQSFSDIVRVEDKRFNPYALSPDGRYLASIHTEFRPATRTQLLLHDLRGQLVSELAESKYIDDPSFSPDSKSILFVRNGRVNPREADLCVLNLETLQIRSILKIAEVMPPQ